jgi:hypothetical protein
MQVVVLYRSTYVVHVYDLKYISAPCTGMIYSSRYLFGVLLRRAVLPSSMNVATVEYRASNTVTPD